MHVTNSESDNESDTELAHNTSVEHLRKLLKAAKVRIFAYLYGVHLGYLSGIARDRDMESGNNTTNTPSDSDMLRMLGAFKVSCALSLSLSLSLSDLYDDDLHTVYSSGIQM
jgi:hypothetical protein